MLNHFVGMGRITEKPELKSTPNGVNVTSFTIAVDRDYKSQNGEKVTDFLNCVAWKHTAEHIIKWFDKGSMICVEGAVNVRKYKDKDGNNRYVTEIVVDKVHFTGEKRNQSEQQTYVPNAYENNSNAQSNFKELNEEDDLPF